MAKSPIEIEDVQRLARAEVADLAKLIEGFLDHGDPEVEGELPEGAVTTETLMARVQQARAQRGRARRSAAAHEAWASFLGQAGRVPPRFGLGDLLVEVYERGGEAGRAALIDALGRVPLHYGVWRGVKRIYKLAEERRDAAVFGVLAARFDAQSAGPTRHDVSNGTLVYLRRRAWRYLRELGLQVPELYPQFAAEVLRRFPIGSRWGGMWVANHLWAHEGGKYGGKSFTFNRVPADLVKGRAFDEAWKRSPDPLMHVLETCEADEPARFAIQGLRRDFADELRRVTPAWLGRLAYRPLESAHEFLIETLEGAPEYHRGKLKGLGLHDAVLELLVSPSEKARAYAIGYGRGHEGELSNELLAGLLERTSEDDTRGFVASVLGGRAPRALGVELLTVLLKYHETREKATKGLNEGFERREVPVALLRELFFGEDAQREWAVEYIASKYPDGAIGAAFFTAILDDGRVEDSWEAWSAACDALGELPVESIDAGWLLGALTREGLGREVAGWLKGATKLPGLDVERVKGLVFHPAHREVALEVLGNTKLVRPRELGLGWLLALARRPDPSLHTFAHRYLLEHMTPDDFAEAGAKKGAGIARLFALALGEGEPDAVRGFAQTYLRCHHPKIGPEQSESKQLSLEPQLPLSAYEGEVIWGALFDARSDVRSFAVVLTRAELRRWGLQGRVYELAESDAREVRQVAYDALLKAGEAQAGSDEEAYALRPDEIDAGRVFAMSESVRKPTREVAVELIRKHYARLGGAERLGWLMQSADREVRLFAVRLLWEKHRPRSLPPGWRPGGKGAAAIEDAGRFADVQALRGLLRAMLFGLPPGRSARGDESAVKRRLPASEVKRNLIELVRDMAVNDAAFAGLVAPVLEEMTGSLAKGEWQACLSALAHVRRAHPGLEIGGFSHGA